MNDGGGDHDQRRIGRFRTIPVSLWTVFGPSCPSPDARLTYMALATGSTANLAGLTLIARDT